jgi:hypothetical protein
MLAPGGGHVEQTPVPTLGMAPIGAAESALTLMALRARFSRATGAGHGGSGGGARPGASSADAQAVLTTATD